MVSPHTDWVFMEAMDTLRIPDPWDIDDFQFVLDDLKTHRYHLFQAELEGLNLGKRRPSLPDCKVSPD
jgi:hypothetical protein